MIVHDKDFFSVDAQRHSLHTQMHVHAPVYRHLLDLRPQASSIQSGTHPLAVIGVVFNQGLQLAKQSFVQLVRAVAQGQDRHLLQMLWAIPASR